MWQFLSGVQEMLFLFEDRMNRIERNMCKMFFVEKEF